MGFLWEFRGIYGKCEFMFSSFFLFYFASLLLLLPLLLLLLALGEGGRRSPFREYHNPPPLLPQFTTDLLVDGISALWIMIRYWRRRLSP